MDDLQRSSLKLSAHLQAAKAYAALSRAERLKVGSVILRDDRIVSIGYNGTPSGRDNTCELELSAGLITKAEVCHAEANALMFAAKYGVATNMCHIVTTHSPCFECAKLIIQAGITRVYYEVLYRDDSPITLLKETGITVTKIT